MTATAPKLAGGFTRRGACPALSAPMQTGDGLLVRLNPIAGGLTPEALIGLCEAAAIHGNGVVEITARGSIQARGLTPQSSTLFAQAVDDIGIPVRTGVPVQTGVLAGLDPDEIADPSPLADGIRSGIAEAGLEKLLGPKVSVVVEGGGRTALDEVSADVRLTATGSGLWQIAIAGDAGTARIVGISQGHEAAREAALAKLTEGAALGREGRARDLQDSQLSHAVNGLNSSHSASRTDRSLIGISALTDGRVALGVALPFGHTSANTLKTFTELARSLGVSDMRPAPKRALLAICAGKSQAQELQDHAEKLGFVTSPDDPRQSVSACAGAPDCVSAHIPARAMAADIASEYKDLMDGSVQIHLSGCPKGCAHPSAAGLVLVGNPDGIGLVVNGTARDEALAFADSDDARRGFADMAALLRTQGRGGETTAQAIRRLGLSALAEAFGQGGK